MSMRFAPLLLSVAVLAVAAAAGTAGEARAQGSPDASRSPETVAPRLQPAPPVVTPPQQAPAEEAPSAQDETPVPGGCPNPGRPLQLIV